MVASHERMIQRALDEGTYIDNEADAMRAYRFVREVAFDLETTGRPGTKDGLSHKKGAIAIVALHAPGKLPVVLHYPRGSRGPSVELMHFLERKHLIGHNITAFDIPFCGKYGFRPFHSIGWIDTLIAEQLAITSGRRDLKKDLGTAVNRRLHIPIDKEMDHEAWGNIGLSDEQLHYVLNDVTLLIRLWNAQRAVLEANGLLDAWELETAVFKITASMIIQGMPLDLEQLDAYALENKVEMESIFSQLDDTLNTRSINSPKKIKEAFADALGVDLADTTNNTLLYAAGLAGDVGKAAVLVREGRQHKKRSMYNTIWLDRFYYEGRINSRYFPLGTDTSRFASRDPNLQQIPSNMRKVFGFPDDSDRVLLKCDYSQLEALVFGILTHENKIIEWYRTGRDIHTEVAAAIYGKSPEEISEDKKNGGNLRKTAKAATFAMLFAGGKRSVIATARKEGVELSDADAGKVIKGFFRNFPRAQAYINAKRLEADNALTKGYAITLRLPCGPKRSLHGVDATASRMVNTLVQGTAAVGLKHGLKECIEAGIAHYIVAVVHDELVLDVPATEAATIQPILEACMKRGMHKVIGIEPKVESGYDTHWLR